MRPLLVYQELLSQFETAESIRRLLNKISIDTGKGLEDDILYVIEAFTVQNKNPEDSSFYSVLPSERLTVMFETMFFEIGFYYDIRQGTSKGGSGSMASHYRKESCNEIASFRKRVDLIKTYEDILAFWEELTSDDNPQLETYFASVEREQVKLPHDYQHDLMDRIAKDDQNALDDLVSANLAMAAIIAKKAHDHASADGITLREFVHQANNGLVFAARKFPTHGGDSDFSDYAQGHIKTFINQLIEDYRTQDNTENHETKNT